MSFSSSLHHQSLHHHQDHRQDHQHEQEQYIRALLAQPHGCTTWPALHTYLSHYGIHFPSPEALRSWYRRRRATIPYPLAQTPPPSPVSSSPPASPTVSPIPTVSPTVSSLHDAHDCQTSDHLMFPSEDDKADLTPPIHHVVGDLPLLVLSDCHLPHGEAETYGVISVFLSKLLNLLNNKFTTSFTDEFSIPSSVTTSSYSFLTHPTPTQNQQRRKVGNGSAHTGAATGELPAPGGIIIAGDLFDNTVLSPYTATVRRLYTVDEEMDRVGLLLHGLRHIAPVHIVMGNHDDRFVKQLGAHMSFAHIIGAALARGEELARRLSSSRAPVSRGSLRGSSSRVPSQLPYPPVMWEYLRRGVVYPVAVTDRDYLFVNDDVCVAHLSMARGVSAALRMSARAALRLRRHVLFGHVHRQGAQREDGSAYWGIGIGACVDDMWYGQKYLRDNLLSRGDGSFTQIGYAVLTPQPDGETWIDVYSVERQSQEGPRQDEIQRDGGWYDRLVFQKRGDMVTVCDTMIGKRVLVWE